MDAKEIKSLLKQAREAIKEKDYKTALKHSKAVTKHEDGNYNGWVFIGVAAQEIGQPDESEEAFQKAINISPEQPLAWQGLCAYYEKQGKSTEYIDTSMQLIKLLQKDKTKQAEVIHKLTAFTKEKGNVEKMVEVMKLNLNDENSNSEKGYSIWKDIFCVLCEEKELSPDMENMKATALLRTVQNPAFLNDCEEILYTCIEPLSKAGFYEKSIELVGIILLEHPQNKLCLNFLVKATVSSYIKTETIPNALPNILTKFESHGQANTWTCRMLKGILLMNSKQYLAAMTELKEALNNKESCIEGWFLLSKVQLALHLNKDVVSSTKRGLKLAVTYGIEIYIIGKFYLLLGSGLAGCRNWEAALKAFEKYTECIGRTPEILQAFCFTLLKMGQLQQAQKIFCELVSEVEENRANILQLEGYLHILREEFPIALQKLRTSVKEYEDSFTLHLIGCVLWAIEEPEKAFKIFTKAAQMDPFYWKNFLYLGHYYAKVDKRKARQCYQKAYELDKDEEETAMAYSTILKDVGDDDANVELLMNVTESAPLGSFKWAWTQLGLYQFERNNTEDAIFSLQNAIRADPFSSYTWECLGDAYLKRGSYESALKAFEKASELNPTAMYPLYQVSTIQKARGLFVDAIDRFKSLLEKEPTYIPALIGLAETLVLLGKKWLDECLFGRSRDCFQEALNMLSRVASISTSTSCLWKLAGDACTFPYFLSDELFPITVPASLQSSELDGPALCNKQELLTYGAKFYGQALMIRENVSSLWHDLGMNCYFQSMVCTSSDKSELAQKSFICLQKAISISPQNHDHWITLGIIASNKEIQNYGLAQHAFLKAIQIERNNAEAWTNLGILYLEQGDIQLAHKAFNAAQSLDPSFSTCWIGQAAIAYSLQHSETMDLYRHASTLASHKEALLGYARSICSALSDVSNRQSELYKYNIVQMDAVVTASDVAMKYIANNRTSPEAYNCLGILLERQKLYNGALKAYNRALELLKMSGNEDDIEKVRANYARLLSIVGEKDNSLSEFSKLKKVDIPLLCSFAFALYKSGEFEAAFRTFERAFKICQDSSDKSHILVAMAMTCQKISPNITDARNLLLQSSQLKPPSVFGLLALYSMGILNRADSLTAAARKELLPFRYHTEYATAFAILSAADMHNKNGSRTALWQLQKTIHCEPKNHELWLQMASCLLQWESSRDNVLTVCLQKTLFHGGNKEVASQIFALSRLAAGYKDTSLYAAQKAVRLHPEHLSNWITLAAACHVTGKDRSHIGWIFSFVRKLAREQGIKSDLIGWLITMEVFHYIYCENLTVAKSRLDQALSVTAFSAEIQSVLQLLNAYLNVHLQNGNLNPLVLAIKDHSESILGWDLLTQLLKHGQKYMEAEKTLHKFFTAAQKFFPKLQIYPLLQLASLAYQLMQDDKDKWISVAENAAGEAVKISPSNQAARFFQGLVALESNNNSLVRRSFEKVVYDSSKKENRWMVQVAVEVLIHVYAKKKDLEAILKLQAHWPENEQVKRAVSIMSPT